MKEKILFEFVPDILFWLPFIAGILSVVILFLGGFGLGLITVNTSFEAVCESTNSANIVSDELYCEEDSDCTIYNTNNCCGWRPVNIVHRSSKEHFDQICAMECGNLVPKCMNNGCAIEN